MAQSKRERLIHAKTKPRSNGKSLNSINLHLSTPKDEVMEEIKKKYLDSSGRFEQTNPRIKKKEKLKLEDVRKFDGANNQFVLKGTSRKDAKPVTKIITVKVK